MQKSVTYFAGHSIAKYSPSPTIHIHLAGKVPPRLALKSAAPPVHSQTMTRAEAARANGALSHGPATDEGKARSSRNATKHGMNSRDVVLSGESQEGFDALLSDFAARYQPVGEIEQSFVFEMAAARWRLRRLVAMEAAVFEAEMERTLATPDTPSSSPAQALAIAYTNLAGGRALANIHRYETRLRKAYDHAFDQLTILQQTRAQTEAAAVLEQLEDEQNEPNDATAKVAVERLLTEIDPKRKPHQFVNACLETLGIPHPDAA